MRILIVEDDPDSRRVITQHASEYFGNYEVATDGGAAMAAISNAMRSNQPYDIVFLDILMPRVNGQELLKWIRNLEEMKGIPLSRGAKIFMTSGLNDENVLTAFRQNANGYLVKPIFRDEFIKEMRKHRVQSTAYFKMQNS